MIRTQIQLTDQQARAVRELAQKEGRSIAEIVRESLDAHLRSRRTIGRKELERRSLEVIGRFRSGLGDLAEEHDKYLVEDSGR